MLICCSFRRLFFLYVGQFNEKPWNFITWSSRSAEFSTKKKFIVKIDAFNFRNTQISNSIIAASTAPIYSRYLLNDLIQIEGYLLWHHSLFCVEKNACEWLLVVPILSFFLSIFSSVVLHQFPFVEQFYYHRFDDKSTSKPFNFISVK